MDFHNVKERDAGGAVVTGVLMILACARMHVRCRRMS
jgi:hypothetical protein